MAGPRGLELDGWASCPWPVFDAEREVTEMLTDDAPEVVRAQLPGVVGFAPARGRGRAFPVSPPVKALLDVVKGALLQGESVTLPGLGTFLVRSHSARAGRNPRTGETIAIPAGERVHFKNAEGLRRLLNPDG